MAHTFTFKRTARLPSREFTLTSSAAFDLAAASSVKFVYRKKGVMERNEIVATVIDAPNKKIRVDFADTDVDTVGDYEWHIEAVFSSKTMCFPEDGYYLFHVIGMIEV